MGKHAVINKKINKGQIIDKDDLLFLRINKNGVRRNQLFNLTKIKKSLCKNKPKKKSNT